MSLKGQINYLFEENLVRLKEFHNLLRCLEISSCSVKEHQIIDRETRISILKRGLSTPAVLVIRCLVSLIKEDILGGRSIHCVLQSNNKITCTVENFKDMTLSVLNRYGIKNLKSYFTLVEAAICKILEEQNSCWTKPGAPVKKSRLGSVKK